MEKFKLNSIELQVYGIHDWTFPFITEMLFIPKNVYKTKRNFKIYACI